MTTTERELLQALDRIVDWAMANRGTPHAFMRCYTYAKGEFPAAVIRAEKLIEKYAIDGGGEKGGG